MAWSRNQVLLHAAAELQTALLQSSVAPVAIIGPLAWSLLTREDGAIRTIPGLTLLIPRHLVLRAAATLVLQGWQLSSPQPTPDTLDWSSHLAFTQAGKTLHLHWRLTPATTPSAIDFETAMLQNLRPIAWKHHQFHVLSPEAGLLHRLCDRPSWDPVPWQADILMMSFAAIDWDRLRHLADKFSASFHPVDPLERLANLRRDWQLPIPPPALAGFKSPQLRNRLFRWGSLLWKA